MKKFVFILLLVFSFSTIVSAQSGRRIKAKPKPLPTPNADDRYSESRSYKTQRIYPPNYRRNKKSTKVLKEEIKEDASTPINEEDIEIKIDATLVTIPVSIHSKNGLYISDVRQDEVKIFENGKEQEIAYFKTSEQPFTVALLIDTSPSTEYSITQIQSAAKAFVRQLKPQDRVLVMEFDGDPQVLTETTTNRQKINKGIDEADFGQGTALYDAVDFALNKRLNKIQGRKAIVLFTDGVDTVSRRTYQSTLRDAEESEAIIFPIYYNTFLRNNRNPNGGILGIPFPGGGTRNTGRGTSAEEYSLGRAYLKELSQSTGGRVFRPEQEGGLTRTFENIAEELRRQYQVAYYPEKEGKVGERKKIKVRVYRPKLIIRARDSYIVGSEK